MRYRSFSSRDTAALGARVAREVKERGPGGGATIIALTGDLGSGKTTFIQGFFRGIGVKERPQSPTFVIARRTPIRKGEFRNIFHVDAYRLKGTKDLSRIGWNEMVHDPQHVVIVEWADRVRRAIPRGALRLTLRHGKKEGERIINRP